MSQNQTIAVLGDIHHQIGLAAEGVERIENHLGRLLSAADTTTPSRIFSSDKRGCWH